MDGQRDFDTREEAEAFAAERRNDLGRFLTVNSWRHVQIYEAPPWAMATKTSKMQRRSINEARLAHSGTGAAEELCLE
jgi:hypothetical protein